MSVLSAYFDDSGTHTGSLVTALGGCVARKEQWDVFTRVWTRALKDEGIQQFHATDLENGYGEFKGWSEERKRRFFKIITNIMREYAKTAIAGLVIVEEYKSAVSQWARRTPAFGDEYNFCFQMCVGQTMSLIDALNPPMPESEQVAFMFDQQGRVEGVTRRNYSQIKQFRDTADRMGALTFGDKKRFIPLHAADYIAYEAYKHLDNRVRRSGRPLRGSLKILVEGTGYEFHGHYFGHQRLTELVCCYSKIKNQQGHEPWWPWMRARNSLR